MYLYLITLDAIAFQFMDGGRLIKLSEFCEAFDNTWADCKKVYYLTEWKMQQIYKSHLENDDNHIRLDFDLVMERKDDISKQCNELLSCSDFMEDNESEDF